jgi:hypothetical protein
VKAEDLKLVFFDDAINGTAVPVPLNVSVASWLRAGYRTPFSVLLAPLHGLRVRARYRITVADRCSSHRGPAPYFDIDFATAKGPVPVPTDDDELGELTLRGVDVGRHFKARGDVLDGPRLYATDVARLLPSTAATSWACCLWYTAVVDGLPSGEADRPYKLLSGQDTFQLMHECPDDGPRGQRVRHVPVPASSRVVRVAMQGSMFVGPSTGEVRSLRTSPDRRMELDCGHRPVNVVVAPDESLTPPVSPWLMGGLLLIVIVAAGVQIVLGSPHVLPRLLFFRPGVRSSGRGRASAA